MKLSKVDNHNTGHQSVRKQDSNKAQTTGSYQSLRKLDPVRKQDPVKRHNTAPNLVRKQGSTKGSVEDLTKPLKELMGNDEVIGRSQKK